MAVEPTTKRARHDTLVSPATAERVYRAADCDGDGQLDREEFGEFFREAFCGPEVAGALTITFSAADSNGSGRLKQADFQLALVRNGVTEAQAILWLELHNSGDRILLPARPERSAGAVAALPRGADAAEFRVSAAEVARIQTLAQMQEMVPCGVRHPVPALSSSQLRDGLALLRGGDDFVADADLLTLVSAIKACDFLGVSELPIPAMCAKLVQCVEQEGTTAEAQASFLGVMVGTSYGPVLSAAAPLDMVLRISDTRRRLSGMDTSREEMENDLFRFASGGSHAVLDSAQYRAFLLELAEPLASGSYTDENWLKFALEVSGETTSAEGGGGAELGDGWTARTSRRNGETYYFNTVTGAKQWGNPWEPTSTSAVGANFGRLTSAMLKTAAVVAQPVLADTELTNTAELTSKVAVVRRGNDPRTGQHIPFYTQAWRAQQAGAVAVIMVDDQDVPIRYRGADASDPAVDQERCAQISIPAFCVGKADDERLLLPRERPSARGPPNDAAAKATEPVVVSIDLDPESEWNVECRLLGADPAAGVTREAFAVLYSKFRGDRIAEDHARTGCAHRRALLELDAAVQASKTQHANTLVGWARDELLRRISTLPDRPLAALRAHAAEPMAGLARAELLRRYPQLTPMTNERIKKAAQAIKDEADTIYAAARSAGCPKAEAEYGPIALWDVSLVTSVTPGNGLFYGCRDFNEDIGDWDMRLVRDASQMFAYCSSFNQDIGRWNVGNLVLANMMFDSANSFDHDIGGWDVRNLRCANAMFNAARSFDQDIGRWDVRNLQNATRMFSNSALNQDLSAWRIENLRNAEDMFHQNKFIEERFVPWFEGCTCGYFRYLLTGHATTEHCSTAVRRNKGRHVGTMTIPENAQPGGTIQFRTPSGSVWPIVLPVGGRPGMTIRFYYEV
jgi:hypothetical protein